MINVGWDKKDEKLEACEGKTKIVNVWGKIETQTKLCNIEKCFLVNASSVVLAATTNCRCIDFWLTFDFSDFMFFIIILANDSVHSWHKLRVSRLWRLSFDRNGKYELLLKYFIMNSSQFVVGRALIIRRFFADQTEFAVLPAFGTPNPHETKQTRNFAISIVCEPIDSALLRLSTRLFLSETS